MSFIRLPAKIAPNGLLEKITARIAILRLRQLRIRFFASSLAFVACVSFVITTWQAIMTDIQSSSFVEMLRLVASDSDILLVHTQDFVWGLIESLPVESILLACICSLSALLAYAFYSALIREQQTYE